MGCASCIRYVRVGMRANYVFKLFIDGVSTSIFFHLHHK